MQPVAHHGDQVVAEVAGHIDGSQCVGGRVELDQGRRAEDAGRGGIDRQGVLAGQGHDQVADAVLVDVDRLGGLGLMPAGSR